MRRYETIFILNANLPEEAQKALTDKVLQTIESHGGKLIGLDPWGRKSVAYPLQKNNKALYFLLDFAGGGGLVAEIERQFRTAEGVARFQTVKVSDEVDIEKAQVEAAERARARAAAAAERGEEEGEEGLEEGEEEREAYVEEVEGEG